MCRSIACRLCVLSLAFLLGVSCVFGPGLPLASAQDDASQAKSPSSDFDRLLEKVMNKQGIAPARVEAAQKMARCTIPPASIPQLARLLSADDEDWNLRREVAVALGSAGPAAKDAVPAVNNFLLRMLASAETTIRANLGRNYVDFAPAGSAVSQTRTYVYAHQGVVEREEASIVPVILSLGNIGSDAEPAVPLLLRLLKDRQLDEKILAEYHQNYWRKPPQGAETTRGDQHSGDIPDPLQKATDRPTAQLPLNVHTAAAVALGKIGSAKSVDTLHDVAKFPAVTQPYIAQAARQALEEMARARPTRAVQEALKDLPRQ